MQSQVIYVIIDVVSRVFTPPNQAYRALSRFLSSQQGTLSRRGVPAGENLGFEEALELELNRA